MKNIIKNNLLLIYAIFIYCNISFSQEWISYDFGSQGTSVDFVNANTGFIGIIIYGTTSYYKIYKTTDKGLSFVEVWSDYISTGYNDASFAFDMITENVGFLYKAGELHKTIDGGLNWILKQAVPYYQSAFPTIKFFSENLGFVAFTRSDHNSSNHSRLKIYKVINGGNQWDTVFGSTPNTNYTPIIKDISISQYDPNKIIMVGFYLNYQEQGQYRRFTLISENGGNGFGPEYDGGSYGTLFSNAQYLPGSSTSFRILGSENYGTGNPDNGTYCYDNFENGNKYKISNGTNNIAGLSFVDANKGYAYVDNKLYRTMNSGVNWSEIFTFEVGSEQNNRNALIAYNDVVYVVDYFGNFITHKLSTNLYTYYDNQSTPSDINFDGTNYPSPSTQYLRGGNSIVYSSLPYIIDPNQSSEKLFYKWSNGKMNYTDNNYYFDISGTEIANYYKSRSLSTTSNAINNSGQVKSWRDTAGAINRIYESIGGIFFSKSYDNGINFKREEIVNYSAASYDGNNNSNPSIFEARDNSPYNSNPVTHWDRNKNMVACWERFNSTSGKTEIKLSARDYEINSDTTFKWNRWADVNEDRFTYFSSSSSFRSFPKIFAVSMGYTNLGTPHDNYFLLVPHLRPASNGNKIEVSCRFNYVYADFQIDSGDISDLSVINHPNTYLSVPLNFVYRKGNKIIYYKAQFNAEGTMAITKTLEEGPTEISIGDGYASRYTPDISLMDNIPVVSYAASYDANQLVEFEGGETETIPITRHPIVKVQRVSAGNWSFYAVYNSSQNQSNPDIEGSINSGSYIINFSQGNIFKKVLGLPHGYRGYYL